MHCDDSEMVSQTFKQEYVINLKFLLFPPKLQNIKSVMGPSRDTRAVMLLSDYGLSVIIHVGTYSSHNK